MRTRARVPIVDPLELVFAAVAAGEISDGGHRDAEAARAALDARYPAGSAGLRAGYLVRRLRAPAAGGLPRTAGRHLLCFGIPRESGAGAVAWTALIPRRLRLLPRAVVIYGGASGDAAGVACLARGVPLSVEADTRDRAADRTGQAADLRLPREYAGAPRFLLVRREAGRDLRQGPWRAPAGPPPGDRGRVRAVRARRWPASDPVLTGRSRPPGSMLKTAAATALLLALALVLAAGGETRRAGGGAAAAASHAGVHRTEVRDTSGEGAGEAPVAPADRGGGAPQALLRVAGALSGHGEPLRITGLRAEGHRVWISGQGAAGPAVAATLAATDRLTQVRLRSSRSPSIEAGVPGSFRIVATVEGRPVRPGAPPDPAAGRTGGTTAAVVRAAATLEDAGVGAVAFEQAGGRQTPVYRLRGFGPAPAVEAAVVGLAALDARRAVHRVELRRRPDTRWDITATLGSRAEGG